MRRFHGELSASNGDFRYPSVSVSFYCPFHHLLGDWSSVGQLLEKKPWKIKCWFFIYNDLIDNLIKDVFEPRTAPRSLTLLDTKFPL